MYGERHFGTILNKSGVPRQTFLSPWISNSTESRPVEAALIRSDRRTRLR